MTIRAAGRAFLVHLEALLNPGGARPAASTASASTRTAACGRRPVPACAASTRTGRSSARSACPRQRPRTSCWAIQADPAVHLRVDVGLLDPRLPRPDARRARRSGRRGEDHDPAALADQGRDRGRFVPRLIREAGQHPEIADLIRTVIQTRRRAYRRVLNRGIARHELDADVDQELVIDLLIGPLWTRLLITEAPIGAGFADDVVDAVLRGFPPPGG